MNRFANQFLAFSLSTFLLLSCQPYKLVDEEKQHQYTVSNPLSVDVDSRAIYKVSIELFRNNLSGLFVIVNADSLYKVGFVSEMGIKFFDMIIDDDGYEVVYCMDALNRKPVLNSIARSLKYIIEDPVKHEGDFFVNEDNEVVYMLSDNDGWKRKYYLDNNHVEQIVGRRLLRKKVFVNLDNYNNEEQPENIIFLQRGMRMRIEMTKL